MPASLRSLLVLGAVLLVPAGASAQFGGGSLRGTSVGVSFNSPIGDFTSLAKSGFGISLKRGSSGDEPWSFRSSISFDRFTGAEPVDNVQFISFGGDIVHQSPRWYQFAGFGLYSTTLTNKDTGLAATELRIQRSSDFGISGGTGVVFGSGEGPRPFVEFSANLVWGPTGNFTWFPIRAGLKFF